MREDNIKSHSEHLFAFFKVKGLKLLTLWLFFLPVVELSRLLNMHAMGL